MFGVDSLHVSVIITRVAFQSNYDSKTPTLQVVPKHHVQLTSVCHSCINQKHHTICLTICILPQLHTCSPTLKSYVFPCQFFFSLGVVRPLFDFHYVLWIAKNLSGRSSFFSTSRVKSPVSSCERVLAGCLRPHRILRIFQSAPHGSFPFVVATTRSTNSSIRVFHTNRYVRERDKITIHPYS